ncbi:hypothetical protein C8T65DRAFT_699649 [Cerioporus squamosus]|nr:hypothetical protein C8T65DRAFT_699649 [Cerioporus squamosus]
MPIQAVTPPHCHLRHRRRPSPPAPPAPAPAPAQSPEPEPALWHWNDVDHWVQPRHEEVETTAGSPPPTPGREDDLGDEEDVTPGPREPEFHRYLDARHCDTEGKFLPDDAPPPPLPQRNSTDFSPFKSRIHFELGDFLYRRDQMSGKKINELMQLWACTLKEDQDPPFAGRAELYETLDKIRCGVAPWEHFSIRYNGELPSGPVPSWMIKEYEVYFYDPRQVLHAQIGNPDFKDDMDYVGTFRRYTGCKDDVPTYVPKRVYSDTGKCKYKDFMTGDWAWAQADALSADPRLEGTAFCAPILGSNKKTVSVATGQNKYYPLYMSNGWVTNSVRRAHCNAITLIGFLAIPKSAIGMHGPGMVPEVYRAP